MNPKKCDSYNTNKIVHCSGSRSTIKRGYWFGSVTGIPTITFCPINYCNFTCCKTTNGYYELSPVRVNQCKSHRSLPVKTALQEIHISCKSCNKNEAFLARYFLQDIKYLARIMQENYLANISCKIFYILQEKLNF